MDHYGSIETGRHSSSSTEDLELLRNNHEMTVSESSDAGSSKKTSRKVTASVLVVMGLWMVLMAAELSPFLFLVSPAHNDGDAAASAIMDDDTNTDDDDDDDALHALWGATAYLGVYNIRQCNVDECLSSPCQDASATPFVCLALKDNERLRGGCGRRPWSPRVCSDQCDAINCDKLLVHYHAQQQQQHSSPQQESTATATPKDCDVECPTHWCHRHRLCGDMTVPYQCTSGDWMYGCSADKYEFTIRSGADECSSCCNTNLCT